MNMLASAQVLTDLTADFSAYAAAAITLVSAVLALRIGIKWAKGLTGRAS